MQNLGVRFFHHGFRERSVVMFVVDLYVTLSYFVSFVHDYCSASLVCFVKVDVWFALILLMLYVPCVTSYCLALLFLFLGVVI